MMLQMPFYVFFFSKNTAPQTEVRSSSSGALRTFPFCRGASLVMLNAHCLNGQAEKHGVCMPAVCISVCRALYWFLGVLKHMYNMYTSI